jgi:hypothetical protein
MTELTLTKTSDTTHLDWPEKIRSVLFKLVLFEDATP